MPPFNPGQIARAGHLGSGPNAYVPQLLGSITDPDLGDGGIQDGTWYRVGPDLVRVFIRLRFGSSGVDNGSGTYSITLPTAASGVLNASNLIAVGQPLGSAQLRRTSPATFMAGIGFLFSHNEGPGGVALARFHRPEAGIVSATAPWAWAENDAIAMCLVYVADVDL
ncbi:hypothetical protein [Phytoactinopolyspora limicola]|uniref:hypothetical protein n=1 Tax=Phytoactinopolyspora limicola TaxID=2715536 RepID=UPI00140A3EC1|nr:hypothetical protein [Phytoactinopolyspora limicola]